MSTRTSLTHPLEIARLPAGRGVIGITFLPGKKGQSVSGFDWDRDLDADMEIIRNHGVRAVVSLVESDEFRWSGVPHFSRAVERIGADWHHLPIRDVGVPDELFEARWSYHGHVLRERLRAGETIIVHCRGGLGRAGLVSARLLVELGAEPDAAIRAVRHVRPGAIETQAQERHVKACRRVDDDESRSLRLGCLFGGAVGDAFGFPVEFLSMHGIRAMHGPAGLAHPVFSPDGRWVVSDDTQMTLFTVEGAASSWGHGEPAVLEAIRHACLNWYRTQRGIFRDFSGETGLMAMEALWQQRAPGRTCLSALGGGGRGTIDVPVNDSKGCGGVMRVASLGVMGNLDPEACFWLSARAAAQTHGHPSGYWSAGALASIVRRLYGGASLRDAVELEIQELSGLPGSDEVRERLARAIDPHTRDITALGEGWVGEEALAIGVHAALHGADFADVLRRAANHDGDSDSTASIAGQIRGAMTGLADIPHDWVRRLDVLDALCVAAQAIEGCRGGC